MLSGAHYASLAAGSAGGETALYALLIVTVLGLVGSLASLRSRDAALGDAIVAVSFTLLVTVAALSESAFLAAYVCSVALLALRDALWLYSSGKASGPLLHRVTLVYAAALMIAAPSLLVREMLPRALSPIVALVAVAALLTYLFTVAEALRRDSYSSSIPR
ncbi:MAG: hypothetical protein QXT33_01780 [Thermofilum sp.]